MVLPRIEVLCQFSVKVLFFFFALPPLASPAGAAVLATTAA